MDGCPAEVVWTFENPWVGKQMRVKMLEGWAKGLCFDLSLGRDASGASDAAPEAKRAS